MLELADFRSTSGRFQCVVGRETAGARAGVGIASKAQRGSAGRQRQNLPASRRRGLQTHCWHRAMRLIALILVVFALALEGGAMRAEDIQVKKWPDDVPCDAVKRTPMAPTPS